MTPATTHPIDEHSNPDTDVITDLVSRVVALFAAMFGPVTRTVRAALTDRDRQDGAQPFRDQPAGIGLSPVLREERARIIDELGRALDGLSHRRRVMLVLGFNRTRGAEVAASLRLPPGSFLAGEELADVALGDAMMLRNISVNDIVDGCTGRTTWAGLQPPPRVPQGRTRQGDGASRRCPQH